MYHVSLLEPHPPQTIALNDLHTEAEVPIPSSYPGIPTTSEPESYKCDRRETELDRAGFERVARNYAGLCSLVDQALGRILWMLEVTGQAENTMVVSVSDDGETLSVHSMRYKSVMYEESIRVPHLLSVPFLSQRSTRVPQPVSHISIVPTLMELLGRDVSGLAGQSLIAVLDGRRPPKGVFLEWGAGSAEDHCGIPNGRTVLSPDSYKLILYDVGVSMLFDHGKDPVEMNNVFGRSEYADVRAQLTGKIAAWQ